MTIEELKEYVKEELHTKVHYSLAGFPDYGVIESPDTSYWLALIIHTDRYDAMDLRYGKGAVELRSQAPFMKPSYLRGADWVGIKLNEPGNDEIIKKVLKRVYEDSLKSSGDVIEVSHVNKGYDNQPISRQHVILPARIKRMKAMYAAGRSAGENFYEQGHFMCDFHDDYQESTPLNNIYPNYHNMTDAQLRYYFTLREEMRAGNYPKPFNNYVYLYINELFNLIGVKNAKEAFLRLKNIMLSYNDKTDVVKRLQGYLDAFTAIYFKEAQGDLLVSRQAKLLSELDPINQVPARSFGRALQKFLGWPLNGFYNQEVPQNYLRLLQKVWRQLNMECGFFSDYVAKKKMNALALMKGIDFGYPLKETKIILPGLNLINRDGRWYREEYQELEGKMMVKKVISQFDHVLAYAFGKKALIHDDIPESFLKVMGRIVHEAFPDADLGEIGPVAPPSKPQQITDIYDLYDRTQSQAKNFYRQGKYMEDFSCEGDKTVKIPFHSTYQDLTKNQLESYFAWRTRARVHRYNINETPVFLYASEIINDIGVKSAQDGLAALRELKEYYPDLDYLDQAIEQYIILHQMKDDYASLELADAYVLDPKHLGSNEEIIAALKSFDPAFGEDNPLRFGNNEELDTMLAEVYCTLAFRDNGFEEYIGVPMERTVNLYPHLIYLERRQANEMIQIKRGYQYRFDAVKKTWFESGYDTSRQRVSLLTQIINKSIFHHFNLDQIKIPAEAWPFYLSVNKVIERYLDENSMVIRDPRYAKEIRFNDILEKLHEMRKIDGEDTYDRFMKQAHFLENVSLEIRPPLIPHGKPRTYEGLNDKEMLTYLYYRTKWRKGVFELFEASGYLSLYMTEIINGIGISDDVAALDRLKDIVYHHQHFSGIDFDFMVIHHLTAGRIDGIKKKDDKTMGADPQYAKDENVFFDGLNDTLYAGYRRNLKSSPVYRKEPALFKKVLYQTVSALMKDPTLDFKEKVMFHYCRDSVNLFQGLLYKLPDNHSHIYEITPIRRYEVDDDGRCFYCYYQMVDGFKKYKDVIHEIERYLRLYLHYPGKLKKIDIDPAIDQAISRIIATVLDKKEEAKNQERLASFSIHFDDLNRIRQDAEVTTEKLITEEEMIDEDEDENTKEEVNTADDQLTLSTDEREVLEMLLCHSDITDYIASHHLMVNVIVDNINEKLFDEIGDNVITFDGDQPVIVDDYIEDIEELL